MPDALLVNNNGPGTMSAWDTDRQARLQALGYTVTVRADNDAAHSGPSGDDAVDYDLLYIVGDSSFEIGTKYRAHTIPAVVETSFLLDEMLMTTSSGDNTAGTAIDVTDVTHPIAQAAGLAAGATTLFTAATTICSWRDSELGAGVAVYGDHDSDVDDPRAWFTYDTGATLADGSTAAPARRAVMPLEREDPPGNATFDALFDAIVEWADPPAPAANTYVLDLDAETVDTAVSVFTSRWHSSVTATVRSDGASLTGRVVELIATGSNRHAFEWTDPPVAGVDVEVLAIIRPRVIPASALIFYTLLRGAGTDASETGMVAGLDTNGDNHVLYRYDNAGFSSKDTVAFATTVGDMICIRERVDEVGGNDVWKRKVWAPADEANPLADEPGVWVEVTANDLQGDTGWVGVGNFTSGADIDIEWLSAGIGGSAAPGATVGAAPVPALAAMPDVEQGQQFTLDMSGSSDAEDTGGAADSGAVMTYLLEFVSGPETRNPTSPNAQTSTQTTTGWQAGTYTYRGSVTDSDGNKRSTTGTVTVTASTNQPPTVDVGPDADGDVAVEHSRTMTADDPDGTVDVYSWELFDAPGGSTAVLQDAATATVRFTPDVAGDYVLRGRVQDNDGAWSSWDSYTLRVATAAGQLLTATLAATPPPGAATVEVDVDVRVQGAARQWAAGEDAARVDRVGAMIGTDAWVRGGTINTQTS